MLAFGWVTPEQRLNRFLIYPIRPTGALPETENSNYREYGSETRSSPPPQAGMDRYERACDGREQSEPLSNRRSGNRTGHIPGQERPRFLSLIIGLILSWAALPGWTELIRMWQTVLWHCGHLRRGIPALCAGAGQSEPAFRIGGVGFLHADMTALLSAAAISPWVLPGNLYPLLASGIIVTLSADVNFLGVVWLAVSRPELRLFRKGWHSYRPLCSACGTVDWPRALDFHPDHPFSRTVRGYTSAIAGSLFPGWFRRAAFEAAACHVGWRDH